MADTNGMTEVSVASLGLDKSSNTPVVILKENEGERLLPIWIGPGEASAIAMELAGVKFSRPLTHDLLMTIVRGLGSELVRVIITKVIEVTADLTTFELLPPAAASADQAAQATGPPSPAPEAPVRDTDASRAADDTDAQAADGTGAPPQLPQPTPAVLAAEAQPTSPKAPPPGFGTQPAHTPRAYSDGNLVFSRFVTCRGSHYKHCCVFVISRARVSAWIPSSCNTGTAESCFARVCTDPRDYQAITRTIFL